MNEGRREVKKTFWTSKNKTTEPQEQKPKQVKKSNYLFLYAFFTLGIMGTGYLLSPYGKVNEVYIEGNTMVPEQRILEASQITRLMEQIKELCILSPKCEITIECNPNSATLDKLRAYKQCGINRISFGVQSFEDKELKLLGRLHNKEQGIQAIEAAKEVGFTNINVDIMMARALSK